MKYLNLILFLLIACQINLAAQDIKVPSSISKDYVMLSTYLCDGLESDSAKAYNIFYWITHHIKYDYNGIRKNKIKHKSANQTLKSRKGICDDYAKLFVAMCKAVNLEAIEIEGFSKSWQFDNGDEIFAPNHQWAAVKINKQWQLVDPTHAAGYLKGKYVFPKNLMHILFKKKSMHTKYKKFIFKFDTTAFSKNPLLFRETNLPSDPIWQLAENILPVKTFEKGTNAVKDFNEKYIQIKYLDTAIDNYFKATDQNKVLISANRIMDYNPNYKLKMIDKHYLIATDHIANIASKNNKKDILLQIDSAIINFNNSIIILDSQKSVYAKRYHQLKKRNSEKRVLTMQHKNEVQQPSRKYFSKSERNVLTCTNNIKKLNAKTKAFRKTYIKSEFESLTLNKIIDKELVKTNTKELKKIDAEIQFQKSMHDSAYIKTKITIEQNAKIYDSIILISKDVSDAIRGELSHRSELYDMFDDELLNDLKRIEIAKKKSLDPLQTIYNNQFDSIVQYQNIQNNSTTKLLSLYKQKIKLLESQKKNNIENIDKVYVSVVTDFEKQKNYWFDNADDIEKYFRKAKKENGVLHKLYDNIIYACKFIKKIEVYRSKFHKNAIKVHEKIDKSNNKNAKSLMKSHLKILNKSKNNLQKN